MTIGIWQVVVILVLVVLIFGTKKLRHLGEDLGAAIKGFKEGIREGSNTKDMSGTKEPPASLEGKQNKEDVK